MPNQLGGADTGGAHTGADTIVTYPADVSSGATSVPPPTFPPGRYGRRRERHPAPRWALPLLIGAVLAIALAAAISGYRNQHRLVQVTVVRFVTGADQVRVTFQVVRPDRTPVDCLVRARNRQGAEIGRAMLRLPAGPRQVTVTSTLPTRGRPVTGEVPGCSAVRD